MIRRVIHQENITIRTIYAPNNRAPNTQSKQIEGENRKLNNSSYRLQVPTFNSSRIVKQNINKRKTWTTLSISPKKYIEYSMQQ